MAEQKTIKLTPDMVKAWGVQISIKIEVGEWHRWLTYSPLEYRKSTMDFVFEHAREQLDKTIPKEKKG